ncbi:choice-of-anchor tandem repeat GloVer-containing protein [Kerstersia sp.]|uniref:choice-of-anchor tandem repeat GloVer-containing protein n=1 Tax=Kerstersia sp. TaxID=1930783 RepID=UPI003F8DC87A
MKRSFPSFSRETDLMPRLSLLSAVLLPLLAVAGAAHGNANPPVSVTHLTSFHSSGENTTTGENPKGWPAVAYPSAPPVLSLDPVRKRSYLFGGFKGMGPLRALSGEIRETMFTAPGLYWLQPSPGLYERLEMEAERLYGLIPGTPVRAPDGMSLYGVMTSVKGEAYADQPDLLDADGNVTTGYVLNFSKGVGKGIVFQADYDGTHLRAVASTVGQLYTPNGALVMDAAGNLYGVDKGPKGQGRIFTVKADGSFGVVHEFSAGPDGRRQVANDLTLGSDGLLYGITGYDRGMPFDAGTLTAPETPVGSLYRIDPAQPASFTVLHTFTLAEGEINVEDNVTSHSHREYPSRQPTQSLFGKQVFSSYDETSVGLSSLVEGPDGWLYGTTSVSQCQLYSPALIPAGTYTVVNAAAPLCGRAHNGTRQYGKLSYPYYDGPLPHGAIYRVRKDGSAFELLHRFSGADGSTPRGSLAVGQDGAIYGTTASGGANRHWSFSYAADGQLRLDRQPTCDDFGLSSLRQRCLEAGAENYVSLQQSGQAVSNGVLYRIVPARIGTEAGPFELLHSFKHNVEGYHPLGVKAAGDGRLYGVTGLGGQGYMSSNGIKFLADDKGAVFTVDLKGDTPSGAVTLVAAPGQVAVGQKAELTWTSFQAQDCQASSSDGSWSGPVEAQGSIDLEKAAGTYRYRLSCTDSVKLTEVSATAVLYVDTSANVDDGNTVEYGNGGAGGMPLGLLALLPAAWAWRRQRQTH